MQRTILLTILALFAFAANSLLNRAALADGSIDWVTFTAIRLIAGAFVLALIAGAIEKRMVLPRYGDLPAILALFGYALAFSFAYISLGAGIGAIILFGCVQITMQVIGISKGHLPSAYQWVGLLLAFFGLIWLLLPGLSAPPLVGSLIMAVAGISWGFYSWFGRSANAPVLATARNFIGTVPLAILAFLILSPGEMPKVEGVILAIVSGMITSALGYVVWYAALPRLSVVTAGVAQLSVPAIAALGGVMILDETLSLRVIVATIVIMSGISLTLKQAGR